MGRSVFLSPIGASRWGEIERSIALRLLHFSNGFLNLAADLLKIALRLQLRAVDDFAGDFFGFARDDVAVSARDIGGARFHSDCGIEG